LSRELDLENQFEDIQIENLIPQALQTGDVSNFLAQLEVFNSIFQTKKDNQSENHVLRYVGELSGDLQQSKGELSVKLVSVPANSALGSLRGSDSIFEIYTESYGNQPIIIQGAGAGAAVTARGVFGDILRLSNKKV
jgi:aspartokinase/homoserine dehydrogenase 1